MQVTYQFFNTMGEIKTTRLSIEDPNPGQLNIQQANFRRMAIEAFKQFALSRDAAEADLRLTGNVPALVSFRGEEPGFNDKIIVAEKVDLNERKTVASSKYWGDGNTVDVNAAAGERVMNIKAEGVEIPLIPPREPLMSDTTRRRFIFGSAVTAGLALLGVAGKKAYDYYDNTKIDLEKEILEGNLKTAESTQFSDAQKTAYKGLKEVIDADGDIASYLHQAWASDTAVSGKVIAKAAAYLLSEIPAEKYSSERSPEADKALAQLSTLIAHCPFSPDRLDYITETNDHGKGYMTRDLTDLALAGWSNEVKGEVHIYPNEDIAKKIADDIARRNDKGQAAAPYSGGLIEVPTVGAEVPRAEPIYEAHTVR